MAQQSTAGEITAFLDQLAGQAEITDFIQNLGRDLMAPPPPGGAAGNGAAAAPAAGIPPPPPYPPGVMPPGGMTPGMMAGMPGGPAPGGGQKLCYKCGQPGHLAKHCPN